MGCAEKLVFSWVGNPGVGSLHRFRDAYENGWPVPLAIEEHSHAAMANAYDAGAAGLPCALFRGYIGVDLPKVNPNIKRISCPFTGEELAVVPAIRPDVAVIHALKARCRRQCPDRRHRRRAEGSGARRPALAGDGRGDRRGFRTAQHQCGDPAELDGRRDCLRAGWRAPILRARLFARDNAFYLAWDRIARDRETFLSWMQANVLEQGPEAFAVHGRGVRVAAE